MSLFKNLNFLSKKENNQPAEKSEQQERQDKLKEDAEKWQNNTGAVMTGYITNLAQETSKEFAEKIYDEMKRARELNNGRIPSQAKLDMARIAFKNQTEKLGAVSEEQMESIIANNLREKLESAKETQDINHNVLVKGNSILQSESFEEMDEYIKELDKRIDATYIAISQKEDQVFKNQIASLKAMSEKLAKRSVEIRSNLKLEDVA